MPYLGPKAFETAPLTKNNLESLNNSLIIDENDSTTLNPNSLIAIAGNITKNNTIILSSPRDEISNKNNAQAGVGIMNEISNKSDTISNIHNNNENQSNVEKSVNVSKDSKNNSDNQNHTISSNNMRKKNSIMSCSSATSSILSSPEESISTPVSTISSASSIDSEELSEETETIIFPSSTVSTVILPNQSESQSQTQLQDTTTYTDNDNEVSKSYSSASISTITHNENPLYNTNSNNQSSDSLKTEIQEPVDVPTSFHKSSIIINSPTKSTDSNNSNNSKKFNSLKLLRKNSSTSTEYNDSSNNLELLTHPLVRKKSGELVKSSLKLPSLARSNSMPNATKSVRFATVLEKVKFFKKAEKPIAVSAETSPVSSPHLKPTWEWNSPEGSCSDDDEDDDFLLSSGNTISHSSTGTNNITWKIIHNDAPPSSVLNFAKFNCGKAVIFESVKLGSSKNSVIGFIYVKNISYQKKITVRLTTDNWKSFKDVSNANYISSNHIFKYNNVTNNDCNNLKETYDKFSFIIKLESLYDDSVITGNNNLIDLKFCIRFETGDQEFWDNNDSKNYQVVLRKETNSSSSSYFPSTSSSSSSASSNSTLTSASSTIAPKKNGFYNDQEFIERYDYFNHKTPQSFDPETEVDNHDLVNSLKKSSHRKSNSFSKLNSRYNFDPNSDYKFNHAYFSPPASKPTSQQQQQVTSPTPTRIVDLNATVDQNAFNFSSKNPGSPSPIRKYSEKFLIRKNSSAPSLINLVESNQSKSISNDLKPAPKLDFGRSTKSVSASPNLDSPDTFNQLTSKLNNLTVNNYSNENSTEGSLKQKNSDSSLSSSTLNGEYKEFNKTLNKKLYDQLIENYCFFSSEENTPIGSPEVQHLSEPNGKKSTVTNNVNNDNNTATISSNNFSPLSYTLPAGSINPALDLKTFSLHH
ncbi:hypothetical protein BVG19_g3584 [[Candida] boidinii]|nr:hypothetical protein BVG19_g3584 [[Candida] boidinii]OWB49603.1 hypothetical protein B5S27_g1144 [[Candida] boidinii]